jgi:OFA family oxalate/formate antiporter-like MFS transporter
MDRTMNTLLQDSRISLFGMDAARGRWIFIPLGVCVLLCLGTVYSWSIFRKPLERELSLNTTQSLLPFTVALVCYAVTMPIAGYLIPRFGVRPVTIIGGIAVGLGYLLSSYAAGIEMIILTYGMIAGTGVGLVYGVPMAVAARWFPDRKGLAVGLTIVGFGLSPLITAPLANQLINAYTVRATLQILGIFFMAFIVLIAFLMRMPPREWERSQQSAASVLTDPADYPENMLRSQAFYGLWICYAIGTLIGLTAVGISSPAGIEIIRIEPGVAAGSVALFAVFNGVSRPLFGWLCDRYSPQYVAIASYVLILIACGLMAIAQAGQVAVYLTAFCLFWFCLGGWLAIAPTTTLRFFHPERYPKNYGIVFTAYGTGALIGTLTAGRIRDWFGSYAYVFYLMAALAVVGIIVAALLLKRDRRSSPAR